VSISAIAPYQLPAAGSWPVARAAWSLQPSRAALLIHDMQEYFLAPYDAQQPPLSELVPNVHALRQACWRAGVPVFFSAQPAEQDRAQRGLLWDLWGAGIIERPELSGLGAGLRLAPHEMLVRKRRYSAFFETELGARLASRGRDQLMICGVYAHIGCLATALDAFMRGVEPFLVADAIADFSPEDHATALRQVARTCGVVAPTARLLQALIPSSTTKEP
jgi:bifunctional isochorismate lyase/aryl carrier protein